MLPWWEHCAMGVMVEQGVRMTKNLLTLDKLKTKKTGRQRRVYF